MCHTQKHTHRKTVDTDKEHSKFLYQGHSKSSYILSPKEHPLKTTKFTSKKKKQICPLQRNPHLHMKNNPTKSQLRNRDTSNFAYFPLWCKSKCYLPAKTGSCTLSRRHKKRRREFTQNRPQKWRPHMTLPSKNHTNHKKPNPTKKADRIMTTNPPTVMTPQHQPHPAHNTVHTDKGFLNLSHVHPKQVQKMFKKCNKKIFNHWSVATGGPQPFNNTLETETKKLLAGQHGQFLCGQFFQVCFTKTCPKQKRKLVTAKSLRCGNSKTAEHNHMSTSPQNQKQ